MQQDDEGATVCVTLFMVTATKLVSDRLTSLD